MVHLPMNWTAAAAAAIVSLTLAACSRSAADPRETAAPARSASASVAPATASPRPRIVFLGDSLTAGYGLDMSQSVPSLIQAHLADAGYAYEVVNAGVSGDTSAGGLSRLDWSLDGDVRVLVLELGANDGLRGLPVDALKQNLETIIGRARQRGIKVILTGMEAPPNYGPAYTAAFRKVYRDLAREHADVVFVPFYLQGVAGDPSLNIADGIHPNPQGARIIERNVWQALEPLLQKDRG
jgi:acyl-CoA thioesterase-1